MVMTGNGPISMCAFNARRDEFILRPLTVPTESGAALWNPLSGSLLPLFPGPARPEASREEKAS
jgi:hypothetical protein